MQELKRGGLRKSEPDRTVTSLLTSTLELTHPKKQTWVEMYSENISRNTIKKNQVGWRDGAVVKSSGFSFSAPKRCLTTSVSPLPGGLMPSSGLFRHCTRSAQIPMGAKHLYT